MGFYTIKTPWLLKKIYAGCTWHINTKEKIIYLSFDDGPNPIATPFVLETLASYDAKASFFCIGKNVVQYPEIFRRILDEGHLVGNHTYNHLNGWQVGDAAYFSDITEASKYIDSNYFRPPYGKISPFQVRHLKARPLNFQIIMWDVLSADFDTNLSPEQCSYNVTRHAGKGSIVVFHDSEKAFPRLKIALPECLKYFTGMGFRFDKLPSKSDRTS